MDADAFARDVDVTKLSYHAYAYCRSNYELLDAGSALGRNCGPLLISARPIAPDEVRRGRLRIAIARPTIESSSLIRSARYGIPATLNA